MPEQGDSSLFDSKAECVFRQVNVNTVKLG